MGSVARAALTGFDQLEFEATDNAQDFNLPIEVAFNQLDVGRIGGELSKGWIDGDPVGFTAKLYLGPCMVIKLPLGSNTLGKHDSSSDSSWNSSGPRKTDKQCRVFIAVAAFAVQHFEAIGDADTWFFGDLGEYPLVDSFDRIESGGGPLDN